METDLRQGERYGGVQWTVGEGGAVDESPVKPAKLSQWGGQEIKRFTRGERRKCHGGEIGNQDEKKKNVSQGKRKLLGRSGEAKKNQSKNARERLHISEKKKRGKKRQASSLREGGNSGGGGM